MFTGLIVETGIIQVKQNSGSGCKLKIGAKKILSDLKHGDSVAVNGTCLTVEKFDEKSFWLYVSSETIQTTTIKNWESGLKVNLERAMRLGDRMGGHTVQGHVDAIIEVEEINKIDSSLKIKFSFPKDLSPYIVPKGSICLDGISLTVNEVFSHEHTFEVRLIPTTLEDTNTSSWEKGQKINLETDIIGRYIVQYLQNASYYKTPAPINKKTVNDEVLADKLKSMGYP